MSAVRWINRTKFIFLGLFALGCAGAWGYQYMYAWPAKRCEAASRWWYGPERACGVPVEISTITGRPNAHLTPVMKAEAAKAGEKTAEAAPKAP